MSSPRTDLRRLRVLFIASYFPKPDNSLMGTWALEQAKALARKDIELLVVSFTSTVPAALALTPGAKAYARCPPDYLWPGDVKTLYPRWLYYPIEPIKSWMYATPQPYLKLAQLSATNKLSQLIEAFTPDVLFCHHSLPNGWLAASHSSSSKQLHPPIITFDHDYDEISDCWQYPRRRRAMQTVVNKAWAMLSVSERMRKDMQNLFPKARRLETHPIGVDLPLEHHLNTQRPPELQNKTIVLSCALFAERKGISLLIRAFCAISQKYPDAVLRVIGDGPEINNVKAAIAHYDRNNQVQLLGKKPHTEVLQEMCWADCFALASWDEPLGAVYLEAMAAGKPIICCNDGGMNELMTSGIHGYAIAPKSLAAAVEALDRLLGEPERRKKMGRQSKQLIAQQMTWHVRAEELIRLFNKAVSSKRQH